MVVELAVIVALVLVADRVVAVVGVGNWSREEGDDE